jgi:hypothetical protein
MTKRDEEVIWGAAAIGAVIGRTARQTFHLLESGHLPAKKVGGRWASRRADLLAALAPSNNPNEDEDAA